MGTLAGARRILSLMTEDDQSRNPEPVPRGERRRLDPPAGPQAEPNPHPEVAWSDTEIADRSDAEVQAAVKRLGMPSPSPAPMPEQVIQFWTPRAVLGAAIGFMRRACGL